MDGEERHIESAIKDAVYAVYGDKYNPEHKHSRRCMHLIRDILGTSEKSIMEVHQSYLASISPQRVILTNKKLIMIRPSFWKLYTGYNLFMPTEVTFIPYHNLISVRVTRGRLLSSIHIQRQGFAQGDDVAMREGVIDGISTDDAVRFTTLLEEIIENIPFRRQEKRTESAGRERAHDEYVGHINKEPVHYIGPEDSQPEIVSLEEARGMVRKGSSRFAWLGIEPLIEVAVLLGVSQSSIISIGIRNIEQLTAPEMELLRGSVLVCYNATISSHLAKRLYERYGIKCYVLEGGIKNSAFTLANSW